MMNYEIFKEIVKEQILSYMPESFKDYRVEVQPVNKVNQTLDGLNLLPQEPREKEKYPTIYVNHIYEEYLESENLKGVLELAASQLVEGYRYLSEDNRELQFDRDDSKIIMVLINTEQNKKLLEEVPHREFQDLSIIYRYVVELREQGIESALINNSLAKRLGMNEQELFDVAARNTAELMPPVVKSMDEIMAELFVSQGLSEEMAEMIVGGSMPEDKKMYVMTNGWQVNGAVSMLYEYELYKLAVKLQSDLYIMPSSIHEVIAISVNAGDPDELAQMVEEINMNQVSLDERLSNQVYHYDKDLRRVSLATDTPSRRLDGVVLEPAMIYEAKQSR